MAAAAFEQLRLGENEIREDCSLEICSISIAASETALHLLLLDRLAAFHRAYPGVHLRITNDSTPRAAEMRRLQDVESCPFVCPGTGTSTFSFYQKLFFKHDLTFHVDMEAATMDQVLPMVQHNLGIGFHPAPMASPAIAAGHVMQIHLAEPVSKRSASLVEDTAHLQSIAMKTLKKMLLDSTK